MMRDKKLKILPKKRVNSYRKSIDKKIRGIPESGIKSGIFKPTTEYLKKSKNRGTVADEVLKAIPA